MVGKYQRDRLSAMRERVVELMVQPGYSRMRTPLEWGDALAPERTTHGSPLQRGWRLRCGHGHLFLLFSFMVASLGVGMESFGGVAKAQEVVCEEEVAVPVASPAGSPVAGGKTMLGATFPAEGGDLTVFAAESLRDAFIAIQEDLRAANPEVTITYNFAGSPTLVTQLSEGGAADVVALANVVQMTAASDAEVISGEPVIFARNKLTVVTSTDADPAIESLADLAQDDVTLALAQADVPAGRYARQAICSMGEEGATYGDDFVARVTENIVSEEENVRAVLTKVQLGEADAGIVYVSDVAGEQADAQGIIPIPDEFNVIATYPIALVEGGNEVLGNAFIAYVLSTEGQATLEAFGFAPAVSGSAATPAAG
ncbi:MAG: molybdate ABC transporter substrate-binding protein [Chloroflexota bacterium]|nr:molybdate ABC transporter substrate-binding protein [Chloroflexota bacterium]